MPDATAASLPQRGTILGFDFGLARVGIAVGELETRQASALTTISEEVQTRRFDAIGQLVGEWQPVALVVGIPRHLDGREHDMTARCRRFANQLHGRFGLPVREIDERLTSAAADTALADAGHARWNTRKTQLDAVAAQIILQDFLDNIGHAPT